MKQAGRFPMPKKPFVALVGAMSLTACTGPEWIRQHKDSDADLEQDQAVCSAFSQEVAYDQAGRLGVWTDDRRVQQCLESRGWRLMTEP
jgi:outer membrane biogenesis lipoprotein LolB